VDDLSILLLSQSV